MKRILGAFLFLLIAFTPALASDGEPSKFWIRFTGKEAGVEAVDLSERTLHRRALRGAGITTQEDLPVSSAYKNELQKLGIQPIVESRWLNAVSARLTPEQARRVSALPFVRDIRPVATLKTTRQTGGAAAPKVNVNQGRLQLSSMNALAPLDRGINGKGVRMGFLDTEFGDFKHPVFAKLVNEGRLIAYKNFTGKTQTDRHGLMTASVAVGFTDGVLIGPAYGAELVAATTEYAGTETNQEEDNFVAGLEWLESQGVDVVNASLGYTTFDAGERSYTYADLTGDVAPTSIAVDMAVKRGVVVVVSAGNEGDCAGPGQGCWYYVGTPADADSAITVGAIAPDSSRAAFSSHGPTADGQIKPDVVALGAYQRNTDGTYRGLITATEAYLDGYQYAAGTSFSGPLVAAVVAQMLQANPSLTPIEVRDILHMTSSQADTPDNHLGWGIVNADAAVREAEKRAAGVPGEPDNREPASASVVIYPHPVSGQSTFQIDSPAADPNASLRLFDVAGRLVDEVYEGPITQGRNRIEIDSTNLRSGVYLYVLAAADFSTHGKMVVVH